MPESSQAALKITQRHEDPPATISDRIAAIEREVDANHYSPGPWSRLVKEIRALPVAQRREYSRDLTRVSRKLHERGGRWTISSPAGYAIEVALAIIGTIVLAVGAADRSDILVATAALIWTMAFQPIIKVGVGYLLGIEYEYTYLFGVEPRFKMRFGQYIAKPRYKRLLLHLSGMIGSPLGAWLPTLFIDPSLQVAIYACWAVFWIVVAINVGAFTLVLTGAGSRVGPIRLADGSGGAAALELREALEI